MGGLLIGHIDAKGNNTVVCGFFPRQDEASSGYCEFHGSFTAIASAACDYANEKAGGDHTPDLRVIGWIHTHPDIGIFLSGIDINTFRSLRQVSFEQRCVAVVVDPIRKQHGVFTSENRASGKQADVANSTIRLSEDLEARYHKFLNRMRTMQAKKGKEEIPFIMPGLLYRSRKALGDVDDILDAKMETLDQLVRQSETMDAKMMEKNVQIHSLQADLNMLTLQLRQESAGKQKIRDHLIQIKKELAQEKQARMEESQLLVSLLATHDKQQKELDDLQNQFLDSLKTQLKEDDQGEVNDEKISPTEAEKIMDPTELAIPKVFDESAQVKPVNPLPEEVAIAPDVEPQVVKA